MITLKEAYENKDKYLQTNCVDYESDEPLLYRSLCVVNGDCNKAYLVIKANSSGKVVMVEERDSEEKFSIICDDNGFAIRKVLDNAEVVIFPVTVEGDFIRIDE